MTEKLVWLYCLAEVALAHDGDEPEMNWGCARLVPKMISRCTGAKTTLARDALLKLEQLRMLTIVERYESGPRVEKSREDKSRVEKSSKGGKNKPNKPTKKAATKRSSVPKTKAVWESYSAAYRKRYGVDPVRNATINAQLSQVIKRLGDQDAPTVAEYYVGLNEPWYVKQGHSVGVFLKDCEKLRTMWATNARTTVIDDKTAHWQNQWESIQKGEL